MDADGEGFDGLLSVAWTRLDVGTEGNHRAGGKDEAEATANRMQLDGIKEMITRDESLEEFESLCSLLCASLLGSQSLLEDLELEIVLEDKVCDLSDEGGLVFGLLGSAGLHPLETTQG